MERVNLFYGSAEKYLLLVKGKGGEGRDMVNKERELDSFKV